MIQNIFILGEGKVGQTLIRQITDNDIPELGIHENPTVIRGTANSKEFTIDGQKIPYQNLKEIFLILSKLGCEGDVIFVDVTSGKDELRDFHLELINKTRYKIVTANKNPISLYNYDTYFTLTQDPTRYLYSATAMAGLGAVPWIQERAEIGDRVLEMTASLSGTLGFLTDQLSQGIRLSAAIRVAIQNGYTEPDFRDDLNGLDFTRKLVILGREARIPVEISDIQLTRFLPDQYFKIPDPEDCLKAIEQNYDELITSRYRAAQAAGKTLKYLGHLKTDGSKTQLKIGFREVPLESAFGRLKGTNNRLEVVTQIYTAEKPYLLEGPGAGLEITASVIRRDLLRMQPRVNRRRA